MKQPPLRLAMWSGPRNLSTAMMYSFAARTDCFVVDEPFYAAYLNETGIIHPMNDEVIAAGETSFNKVADYCKTEQPEGKALFYQKQMTQHLVSDLNLDWIITLCNVFLIRDPSKVIASYHVKNEDPCLKDIGIKEQWDLYNTVYEATGTRPLVIDSDDILVAPELMLTALCKAVGIEFQQQMLSWKAGPKPYDGVWAPHWYQSVWKSTGFGVPSRKTPTVPKHLASVQEKATHYYDKLRQFRVHHSHPEYHHD